MRLARGLSQENYEYRSWTLAGSTGEQLGLYGQLHHERRDSSPQAKAREGKRIGDLLRSSDGGIWVFAQSFRQVLQRQIDLNYIALRDNTKQCLKKNLLSNA
uniref:Uncharacterized protein n=1 Tax=Oryza rufipogon TaxID=4529 RepID=A0A0E0PF30_ORYRU